MDEQRLVVTIFGVTVASVLAYLAVQFIAALTVAIFLYYSTRRVYGILGKLRLPARIRAVIVISLFAVPLLLLISYTVVLIIIEARHFIDEYPVIELTAQNIGWFDGLEGVPELTFGGLYTAYIGGNFDPFIDFIIDNATIVTSTITGFFLNLLIVVVVTYYLLIDGGRARGWVLKFDDDAIVREYLEAADDELEAVLFGNLLNVIVISLVAIITFMGYNVLVPPTAEIPYPALAGALTGVASLIPVVGMKIIYVPVAIFAAIPIILSNEYQFLAYIVGFLIITLILVDTIPDLLLRPYLSGKRTHVGLLMLAYIFGPIVFGFYGLFLAPILLVLGLTFAHTALPQLLGAESSNALPADQSRLDDFYFK